jgi:hypothetical protein
VWDDRHLIVRVEVDFVSQHSALLIAGSLKPRQRTLCMYAMLSLECGLSGYLCYGDVMQGSILLIRNATCVPRYDHIRRLCIPTRCLSSRIVRGALRWCRVDFIVVQFVSILVRNLRFDIAANSALCAT